MNILIILLVIKIIIISFLIIKFCDLIYIKLSPDLRGLCYKNALNNDNEKEAERIYSELYEYFKTTTLSEEQNRILLQLGSSKYEKLIKRTLDLCLSNEIKNQDMYIAIAGCSRNPYGSKITWEWFKLHYNEIMNALRGGTFLVPSTISYITSVFKTIDMINELKSFFSDKDISQYQRTLNQSYESV